MPPLRFEDFASDFGSVSRGSLAVSRGSVLAALILSPSTRSLEFVDFEFELELGSSLRISAPIPGRGLLAEPPSAEPPSAGLLARTISPREPLLAGFEFEFDFLWSAEPPSAEEGMGAVVLLEGVGACGF